MNKTFIVPILIAVVLGSLFGNFMFDQYRKNEMVFNEQNKVYYFQQGIYDSIEEYESATSNLPFKVLEVIEGKYYCYVGMTKNSDNIDKLNSYFMNLGIETYINEKIIDNFEFINNLVQFDILLSISDSDEEIEAILNTILSSYEEMVLGSE